MIVAGIDVLVDISIHAPVKRATIIAGLGGETVFYFNPRSREESDLLQDWGGGDRIFISIHAPVKRATFSGSGDGASTMDFNPRSREESDCSMIHPLTNIWSAFNSKRVPTAEPTYTDSASSRAIEIMPQIDNITI